MKFYSSLKINLVSIIVSIIIYIFLMEYIPQLYKVAHAYLYYKTQPNLIQEYEEEITT